MKIPERYDPISGEDLYAAARERIADLEAENARLRSNSHKWTGCQRGGSPVEATSSEWVRYCEYCGSEDTCEDDMPACEVTREYLQQQLQMAQEENARLKETAEDAGKHIEDIENDKAELFADLKTCVSERDALQQQLCEAQETIERLKAPDFVTALSVANDVFKQYQKDQYKWWRRMDGTPILNDIAVRMAEAFIAAREKG